MDSWLMGWTGRRGVEELIVVGCIVVESIAERGTEDLVVLLDSGIGRCYSAEQGSALESEVDLAAA